MRNWVVLVLWVSWVTYLASQNAPPNTVFYQCNRTSISVAVKRDPLNNRKLLDPERLILGKCHVSSTTALQGFLVFEYGLYECRFSRMVFGNAVKFFAELAYMPPDAAAANVFSQPFQQQINCISNISMNPTPIEAAVVVQVSGAGQLDFSFQIMNDVFSEPLNVKEFLLGSPMFLAISVATANHMPLQLFVDECVVAPTKDLSDSVQGYDLINNHGCFVDGKVASSRFVEPLQLDTIKLTFPAMKFVGTNDEIYLHFMVMVWDPKTVNGLKTCSYLSNINRYSFACTVSDGFLNQECIYPLDTLSRLHNPMNLPVKWQLLGNPQSDLCSCCDSICRLPFRRRRDAADKSDPGIIHTMVLGPFKITSPNASNETKALEKASDFPIPPVAGALFLELAVLLLLSLGVAVYGRAANQESEELQRSLLDTHENKTS